MPDEKTFPPTWGDRRVQRETSGARVTALGKFATWQRHICSQHTTRTVPTAKHPNNTPKSLEITLAKLLAADAGAHHLLPTLPLAPKSEITAVGG